MDLSVANVVCVHSEVPALFGVLTARSCRRRAAARPAWAKPQTRDTSQRMAKAADVPNRRSGPRTSSHSSSHSATRIAAPAGVTCRRTMCMTPGQVVCSASAWEGWRDGDGVGEEMTMKMGIEMEKETEMEKATGSAEAGMLRACCRRRWTKPAAQPKRRHAGLIGQDRPSLWCDTQNQRDGMQG